MIISDEIYKESRKNAAPSDEYGKSTVCNIYYDTPDSRIIRRSLEGPEYKEKLRLRRTAGAFSRFMREYGKCRHIGFRCDGDNHRSFGTSDPAGRQRQSVRRRRMSQRRFGG